MRRLNKASFFFLLLFTMVALGFSTETKKVHKEFDKKKKVELKLVSGDCHIETGNADKIIVDLEYSTEPEGAFKPEFDERSNSIRIKERWTNSRSSEVLWKLKVPKGTEIEFSAASGDLSIYNYSGVVESSTASGDVYVEKGNGELDLNCASGDIEILDYTGEISVATASGDVKAKKIKGEIELSTASGDIDLSSSEGEFELGCASGDIKAKDLKLSEDASFSTASGDVEVKLAETAKYDVSISTASGDATLDYNGNDFKGYFEMTARKDKGEISAPVSFDREEEYEKHGKTYERKSFTSGGNSPKIFISTSSGKAALKK